jgi:integrase
MKKSLTDVLVRSALPPTTGRLEITDERCPGLTLRVTAAGVRSWSFRFRDPACGGVTRATIGKYPSLSLSDARDRANELRRTVARGVNPVDQKRRSRSDGASRTFQTLADRYIAEHARRFKRSASVDERNLRKHVLPQWAKRRFDQIERRDVIALVEALVTAGTPVLANRVQALVSGMFSFAIDADLLAANPCARLRRRGVERAGERVLSDPEIQLFWNGIVEPPVSRRLGLVLRLELLTGVRPGEAAGMRMDELEHLGDPARAAWAIPAGRMKAGRDHYAPLVPMARDVVLEALKLAPGGQPFVFAPPRAKGAIRANALAVAMQRFGRALKGHEEGADTWKANPPTPHDLRRTVATRLAELGVSGEDVAAVLAHATSGVTKMHYDRYSRAREKRRALELWAHALQGILSREHDHSNVVSLVRAGA